LINPLLESFDFFVFNVTALEKCFNLVFLDVEPNFDPLDLIFLLPQIAGVFNLSQFELFLQLVNLSLEFLSPQVSDSF